MFRFGLIWKGMVVGVWYWVWVEGGDVSGEEGGGGEDDDFDRSFGFVIEEVGWGFGGMVS